MVTELARNWWILLLRGICAVLFGLFAFTWPGITLTSLVLVFGVYVLLDGVGALALGFSGGVAGTRWWQMILVGIVSILAGSMTFLWPGVTAVVLVVFIAAWSIVRGVAEIVAAIHLRTVLAHEWLLGLAGACSVLFGVGLMVWPSAGALALLWIIGIYALVFGALTIALAFKLHALKPHHGAVQPI